MSEKSRPKILIITTPLRPVPTMFPPIGSLSVATALKKSGAADVRFYNIDLLRPEYSEVLEYIKNEKPDILGISAVVSTAYEYSKRLSLDIKRELPELTILLGGNMGASAEVILKKTGVDFVCTGEGEKTAVDFVNCWKSAKNKNDYLNVKGLAFFDEQDELQITAYAEPLAKEEVYDIDWSEMEASKELDWFIPSQENSDTIREAYAHDPRCHEPHRNDKTVFTFVSSKGCVARCTFCHRWDKGYRVIPIPSLMKRIDYFIEKYNVGFLDFGDENFGSDRRWLIELLSEIKKRDLLWRVAGMRVSTLDEEIIVQMKEAGCVSILCGMESGSQRMLDVMEKVTTVEQNKNTLRWLAKHNIPTVVQLVIGSPGESPETIQESCDFAAFFAEQSPETDPNDLSINFAQALPGTPLYEVGRRNKKIGSSLEEEEQYLLNISDRDARDGETRLNFTDYPMILLEKWRFDIQIAAQHACISKWGKAVYFNNILNAPRLKHIQSKPAEEESKDSGYFADPARIKEQELGQRKAPEMTSMGPTDTVNEKTVRIEILDKQMPSILSLIKQRAKVGHIAMFYPRFFWQTRHFLILFIIANTFRKYPRRIAWNMTKEYLLWKLGVSKIKGNTTTGNYLSLRKVIKKNLIPDIETDHPIMAPLRKGR
ncbi:MAG: radical SAM protein [Nitrospinae bacterium CG11_big_fil_rev_8_21_14_0_20_45_15]|nr:MAG: radical SAM protein [Nitrospinae bacterium CG11_big_fil_rev_8_21_14_0_20_45_15]